MPGHFVLGGKANPAGVTIFSDRRIGGFLVW